MGNKSSQKKFSTEYGSLIIYKNEKVIYDYSIIDTKDNVLSLLISHLDRRLNIIDPILNEYKKNRISICEKCLVNNDELNSYLGTSKCKKCNKLEKDIIKDTELWRKHMFNMLMEFPNSTVKEYKGNEYNVKIIID